MDKYVFLLLIFISLDSNAQINNGYYIGYERMCWLNDKGKKECYDEPRKWYHQNHLLIQRDSVYIYKVPIHINRKDTFYSSADGGFYYYTGKVYKNNSEDFISIVMTNSDYGAVRCRIDSLGFMIPILDTLTFNLIKDNKNLIFDDVSYKRQINDSFPISRPYFDSFFKFDENSIYRVNPIGQYNLINQCLQDYYLQDTLSRTDTISICLSRLDSYNNIVETLDANLLRDTLGEHITKYLIFDEIKREVEKIHRPIRYIMIDEIIDYKKSARISLSSKIMLPTDISNFKDREYFASYEYLKNGNKYILQDSSQTGWSLINK